MVEYRGKESEFEWKIKNFALIEGWYESPRFTFEEESWRLVVYIRDGYIYPRLWKQSKGSGIEVEFSVALKTLHGSKIFKKRERKYFEESGHNIDEWICRSEFIRRQTELLSSGCLIVNLTMKRVDSLEPETANGATTCSYCKENLLGDKTAFHKKCLDTLAKCPRCNKVVCLQNWFDHECQMPNVKEERSTSQPSGCQSKNKILQDLKQMFLNQENCDVVLRVQDKEFSVHKNILMARSPVFASTFRNNMKENATGVVDIEDIDPSPFSDFLQFLYCGELENLSAENVCSLFTAADKYLISDLRTMCLEFMKNNLSVETFCETIVLALLHTETELINVCTDFFIRNAGEIIKTVKWQSFVTENPIPSNELFTKYVESIKQSK